MSIPLDSAQVIEDNFGQMWNVHHVKISDRGVPVHFGWPCGATTGRGGCGAPRIVLTTELETYLVSRRNRPENIDLPIGESSVRRLFGKLGFDLRSDRERWWRERRAELTLMIAEEFAARYGIPLSKVKQARSRLRAFAEFVQEVHT